MRNVIIIIKYVLFFLATQVGTLFMISMLTGFEDFYPINYNYFYGIFYLIVTFIQGVLVFGEMKDKLIKQGNVKKNSN